MILDVNSIFIRYSITINSFFNKFSKLTQNTKINAIFVHVKTAYCFHRLAYLGFKSSQK